MDHYFDSSKLKQLDMKTIIEKLKLIEKECGIMLDRKARKEDKVKYKFVPVETH